LAARMASVAINAVVGGDGGEGSTPGTPTSESAPMTPTTPSANIPSPIANTRAVPENGPTSPLINVTSATPDTKNTELKDTAEKPATNGAATEDTPIVVEQPAPVAPKPKAIKVEEIPTIPSAENTPLPDVTKETDPLTSVTPSTNQKSGSPNKRKEGQGGQTENVVPPELTPVAVTSVVDTETAPPPPPDKGLNGTSSTLKRPVDEPPATPTKANGSAHRSNSSISNTAPNGGHTNGIESNSSSASTTRLITSPQKNTPSTTQTMATSPSRSLPKPPVLQPKPVTSSNASKPPTIKPLRPPSPTYSLAPTAMTGMSHWTEMPAGPDQSQINDALLSMRQHLESLGVR